MAILGTMEESNTGRSICCLELYFVMSSVGGKVSTNRTGCFRSGAWVHRFRSNVTYVVTEDTQVLIPTDTAARSQKEPLHSYDHCLLARLDKIQMKFALSLCGFV